MSIHLLISNAILIINCMHFFLKNLNRHAFKLSSLKICFTFALIEVTLKTKCLLQSPGISLKVLFFCEFIMCFSKGNGSLLLFKFCWFWLNPIFHSYFILLCIFQLFYRMMNFWFEMNNEESTFKNANSV